MKIHQKICNFLILAYVIGHCSLVKGQFFTPGEDPASIQWHTFESKHFKLVYPDYFYAQANRFANELEYHYNSVFRNQESDIRKFPVILHTESVVSNAFVSWAPKRMEVVATPGMENYPSDWLTQISLHEQVHIRQVSRLKKGFGRALQVVFGQAGYASLIGSIPFWKIEGDAVLHETAFSQSGRGRLPEFNMYFRAHILDQYQKMSYDKAVLGSYNNYIPNWYTVGYPFALFLTLYPDTVSFGTGSYFQAKPFQKYSNRLFYQSMERFKYLYHMNLFELDARKTSTIYHGYSQIYENYRYPQKFRGNMVVEKAGLSQTQSFVTIDKTGNEYTIHKPGIRLYNGLTYGNNKLYWDELQPDPRWDYRNYSIIQSYNLRTGKVEQLSRKSRYFSPVASPDGSQLAVVEQQKDYSSTVVLLDAISGQPIKQLASSEQLQFSHPGWVSDSSIAVIASNNLGNAMFQINTSKNSIDTLIPFTKYKIDQPVGWKNYIIYRETLTGVDNIFALNIHSRKKYQITNAAYGAFDPFVDHENDSLYYTSYTTEGFRVQSLVLDTAKWRSPESNTNPFIALADSLSLKMQESFPMSEKPNEIYSPRKYNKFTNLFQFHSWAPFYTGLVNTFNDVLVQPGFTLLSQNELNTALTTLGYQYHEGNHFFVPTFTYTGWYPVFEFSAKIGGTPKYYTTANNDEYTPTGIQQYYQLNTYVPLQFQHGVYSDGLRAGAQLEYRTDYYLKNNQLYNGFLYLTPYVSLYRLEKRSFRDLMSPTGIVFQAYYTSTPAEQTIFGDIITLRSTLLFRGFIPHHHITIKGSWQKQYLKSYYLNLNRSYPVRGYPIRFAEEEYMASGDYLMPLLYPDWSLFSILYIKRFKLGLFGDYVYLNNGAVLEGTPTEIYSGDLYSLGYEFSMDFHVLRFVFPFNAGLRHTYRPSDQAHRFELLFSIDTSAL